jgi:hypothetical protein
MLGLYPLLASSVVELFQAFVLERLDHAKSVARCATLFKPHNASNTGLGMLAVFLCIFAKKVTALPIPRDLTCYMRTLV